MIEKGLALFITGDTGVAALIGDRLYPTKLPEGTARPAVTYARTATRRDYGVSGVLNPVRATVEVSCWGDSYADAKTLADAVRQATRTDGKGNGKTLGDGYRGPMGAADEFFVQKTDVGDDADGYAPPVDESDQGVYSVSLSVGVWFVE